MFRSDNMARHHQTCREKNGGEERRGTNKKSTNFFLTWNEHVKYISRQLDEMDEISAFIICNEKGAGQLEYNHSHAVIRVKEEFAMNYERFKVWWAGYDLPEFVDIETCKNVKSSVKYSSKEDYLCDMKNIDHDWLSVLKLAWCYSKKSEFLNPLSYPYCRMMPCDQKRFREYFTEFVYRAKIERAKDKMADCELYAWQRKALEMVKLQNDRNVLWIYDSDGNKGKTFLGQYMQSNLNCIVMESGSKKDLAFTYNNQEFVVFNFTRSMEDRINYDFIEALKYGRLFSAKYESQMKIFEPAKVICLANFLPDRSRLSADRWMVWELLDTEHVKIL